MMEETVVEISQAMREVIALAKSPSNLLPISQVFPEIIDREGREGRTTLRFNLSCPEKAEMPDSLMVKIADHRRTIFKNQVIVRQAKPETFPGRNMYHTDSIRLSEAEFAAIWNNPDAEVTFSADGKSSTISIYV